MTNSVLRVTRIKNGYLIRIAGRGTFKESATLHSFVSQYLASGSDAPPGVAVDLRACTYLDSTFLGCLLTILRQCRNCPGCRYHVVADRPTCERLLRATNLDQVLPLVADPPESLGDSVPLEVSAGEPAGVAEHIWQSHAALASTSPGNAKVFQPVADALARDLKHPSRKGDE